MDYTVKIIKNRTHINDCTSFGVESFQWRQGYAPKTYGKLAYLENEGFYLEMICEEIAPKRVHTQNDQMVCEDSCMEAFINFDPQKDPSGYVNFEINANGAMLCQYGQKKPIRHFVSEKGFILPQAEAVVEEKKWTVKLFIPKEFIFGLYGEICFKDGSRLSGNFFKCGDLTSQPHYGSWMPIQSPVPNFHLPEFFGELVLQL